VLRLPPVVLEPPLLAVPPVSPAPASPPAPPVLSEVGLSSSAHANARNKAEATENALIQAFMMFLFP
jgi:hypothetical protein